MKALVAMSGGVDSSVAAALMLEGGYDVVGVTLKQWQGPDGSLPITGCCTVSDAEDARSVATRLGVPYYVLDHVDDFTAEVVDRFGREYLAGRTPNPCIECNRRVRFGALFERMDALGCDVLVTGHHARVDGAPGMRRLRRGVDPAKDQSYVLHMLSASQLDRIELPIGNLTKSDVRQHAARLGLRTADKPDSQDLCFVAGDYREVIRDRFPGVDRPGTIVDTDGVVLGDHGGTTGFTVGQRKGLGIALGEPRFVVRIEAESGTVVVGRRADLLASGCVLEDVAWVAGSAPADTDDLAVQVRYRSPAVPARLVEESGRWLVRFSEPQEAVAPGQAGVVYRGDEVLGGGTIAETRSEVRV
jgi:tRNA-specific 2-thiouridylase